MNIADQVKCINFPCQEIDKNAYMVPGIDIDPQNIQMIMISEVPSTNPQDYFYAAGNPFYMQTTIQAFQDAGANVSNINDILKLGIYITTAVKCGKTSYNIPTDVIYNCSHLLEKELNLFPNVKVIILNGDVAIKSLNRIVKKKTGKRVIPAGSTYKIRKETYYYDNIRVFPSYILTGKNFLIEKSKRRMIAEDIREALKIVTLM